MKMNNTYEVVMGNEVMETIQQQGRCEHTMSFIIMESVYSLVSKFKVSGNDIEVYNRTTGQVHRYV